MKREKAIKGRRNNNPPYLLVPRGHYIFLLLIKRSQSVAEND